MIDVSPATRIGKWASCLRPQRKARLRLFCLPYAGGGASIYRDWVSEFPEQIEVWTVHLPGRESRLADPAISDLEQLAAAASIGLQPFLSRPYAFFGHSMGALIAFELTRRLRQQGRSPPACLAVSAAPGPHVAKVDNPIHALPLPAFLQELKNLNGTPTEVFANSELLELMLPMLRADFCAVENYRYQPDDVLGCPILTFGGASDAQVSRDELEAWREQTTGSFSLKVFPGDHFYFRANRTDLLTHLARDLASLPL
jgi:medium-chain acyl-[acyl-carrier-protein] hydrolase